MMKKLVGNVVSVLLEVLMWITFIGCTIGGLGFGYSEFGAIGAVGGLVLGAIVGMLVNTGWWLISVFMEIRNYSEKWLGKYKAVSDSQTPAQTPMPDFHFLRILTDNRKKIIISLVLVAVLAGAIVIIKSFVNSDTQKMATTTAYDNFTDPRNNQTYNTVKIGTQIWMAENLNTNTKGSKCYNDDPAYCQKYGRLYSWQAALKACPSGWHLPSNAEWEVLYRFVDGTNGPSPYKSETAGKYLKAESGWENYEGMSGNGTDDYGFAALPGGLGYPDGRSATSIGKYGNWWSSTEYDDTRAYNRFKTYKHNNAGWETETKDKMFSIRCLQNNQSESSSTIPGNYPQGSERLLTASDLQGISKPELRIMRNEIFARHSYIFKSDDLKEHFGNLSWYTPKYSDVTSELTDIELKNIKFIQSYE